MYFLVTPRPNTLADIPWMSVTRSHGSRASFDAAVTPYERGTPATVVPGLGDHAVTASSFLFVFKGDNILSIQPGNTEIPTDQVTAFATKALARL